MLCCLPVHSTNPALSYWNVCGGRVLMLCTPSLRRRGSWDWGKRSASHQTATVSTSYSSSTSSPLPFLLFRLCLGLPRSSHILTLFLFHLFSPSLSPAPPLSPPPPFITHPHIRVSLHTTLVTAPNQMQRPYNSSCRRR